MMSLYRTIKTGTLKKRRESSAGPPEIKATPETGDMVSRRKILSRSRDDLTYIQNEEDVWYSKDKLVREHIQEVLDKWTQIDDEIWAKVIVFERNRRLAKAYARTPVLTINGSDDGFDGMRIGLCGFDNPMRDQKTEELKRHIGQGIKLKMDDSGNILVRRYSKSNIYVKGTGNSSNQDTSIGSEILKAPNQCLELEKVMKVFDMKKFQSNVNRELSRSYPDRRRLETQCMSAIAFVKSENDLIDCPIWVMIVNVVAMDMLKSKLPQVYRAFDIRNRPRIPIPDEDPYSIAGNEIDSSASSGFGTSGIYGQVAATREQFLMQQQQQHLHRRNEKPPKLPPRDNLYGHHELSSMIKPDYDEIDDETRIKVISRGKSDKAMNSRKYDDPYYCGLRARVPNFVKEKRKISRAHEEIYVENRNVSRIPMEQKKKRMSIAHMDRHQPSFSSLYQLNQINEPRSNNSLYQRLHHHSYNVGRQQQSHSRQVLYHAKSYESGIDSEMVESPYHHLYGRLPAPSSRGYVSNTRGMYIGDWE
ncbi:unnamed protein product [Diamesa serratosioi]